MDLDRRFLRRRSEHGDPMLLRAEYAARCPPGSSGGGAEGAPRECAKPTNADCLHWSGSWMGRSCLSLMMNILDALLLDSER